MHRIASSWSHTSVDVEEHVGRPSVFGLMGLEEKHRWSADHLRARVVTRRLGDDAGLVAIEWAVS